MGVGVKLLHSVSDNNLIKVVHRFERAEKGLTSRPLFVVSYCEFVTFPLVSWVRCGT